MEDARADLTGEIVDGRFRVEARLGGGGMGTVWRVQHVVSLQPFALKTLDPRAASQPEATRRFVREARAAAALRTRHVVKIVDAQMEYRHKGQPLPFLVMELLEGQTLLELLDARGRLKPGEAAWLVGQLGRALDAAHRQGIVHRDLKPSNVFIAEDDERQPTIKLCDFGIAKLIDAGGEGSLETNTGALLGTPMYLAPEMLRGAGDAVPATDQWALGLLAFRALAGIEYFGHARGFSALVLAIANDPMRAPSQRGTSLPAAFDGWFLRSCARDPAARFPDVPAQVVALAAARGCRARRSPQPGRRAPSGPSSPGPIRPSGPRRPRRARRLAPARAPSSSRRAWPGHSSRSAPSPGSRGTRAPSRSWPPRPTRRRRLCWRRPRRRRRQYRRRPRRLPRRRRHPLPPWPWRRATSRLRRRHSRLRRPCRRLRRRRSRLRRPCRRRL